MSKKKEPKMLKYIAPDSAIGQYLITQKPRFLWSFIFSLSSLLIFVLGAIHYFTSVENDRTTDAFEVLFNFISAGAATMGLSRLFYGDLRASVGCAIAFFATIFISQFA